MSNQDVMYLTTKKNMYNVLTPVDRQLRKNNIRTES